MESFGKYIRGERERKGVSLDEISRVTKVGLGQLKAIENDDFGALPPIAFVKGFVRAYARHIGLEPDEAIIRLEQYISEIEGEEDSFGEKAVRQFRKASPDPRMVIAVVAAGLLVLIVVIVLAVRSCGKGENALRDMTPQSKQNSTLSEYSEDKLLFVNSAGESANPALPMVPPQSFRINKIGRPEKPAPRETNRGASEDYSAGGSPPSPH